MWKNVTPACERTAQAWFQHAEAGMVETRSHRLLRATLLKAELHVAEEAYGPPVW